MSILTFFKRLTGTDEALQNADRAFNAELSKLAEEREALSSSGNDIKGILEELNQKKQRIKTSPIVSGVSMVGVYDLDLPVPVKKKDE